MWNVKFNPWAEVDVQNISKVIEDIKEKPTIHTKKTHPFSASWVAFCNVLTP